MYFHLYFSFKLWSDTLLSWYSIKLKMWIILTEEVAAYEQKKMELEEQKKFM